MASASAAVPPSQNGNGAAPPDGRFLQVIDEAGAFFPTESSLSKLVTSTLPSPSSASYSVIGIMGAQSGGKVSPLTPCAPTYRCGGSPPDSAAVAVL